MKIGVITEIINNHSGARAPLQTAKNLAKRRNKVTVYAYRLNLDLSAYNELRQNGVRIVLIKKVDIPLIGNYVAALSLFRELKKDSPQALIFSGTLPFFLAGRLTRLPIIRMYMGTQFDAVLENTLPDQEIPTITKLLNAIGNVYIYFVGFVMFFFSTKVVAISKYAAWEGKSLYKRKVDAMIYLGSTYLYRTNNIIPAKKTDYVSLLTVSRITPYKGFHLIIEAVKKVKTNKKLRLTIAGSQPKTNYVNYLKKLGGENVQIIIEPSDRQLANLYQQSDIYANADRYLYFGLPIVEAAQFSKPTISFNYAAAAEVIDHGKTGFIAKDVKEFAEYLSLLINDNGLKETLGKNAKKKSKHFSWEKCASEWEKITSY